MIVEMRIYTITPGRVADFVELYENKALAIQKKYLGELLGFYVTEVGPLNQVVHLWRYESMGDRETRRARMDADPAWTQYRAASKELNILMNQETRFMKPTSFSPQ